MNARVEIDFVGQAFILPPRINIMQAFTADEKQLDFVLPGLLSGTVGCLYSLGGTGKSMLSLELVLPIAAHMQRGADLLGITPPAGGRVVVISLEDPAEITLSRLRNIGALLPTQAREAAHENLDILPLLGTGFNILCEDDFHAILNYCKGARLIIFDTLSRICPADYNDPAQARLIMRRLEKLAKLTGAAIIFLHHVSKSAVRAGQGADQTAAQGASALIDDARWAASLTVMSADEAKQFSLHDRTKSAITENDRNRFVKLSFSKINYSMRPDDLWFERGYGGVLKPAILFPLNNQNIKGVGANNTNRNSYLDAKNWVNTAAAATEGDDDDDY